MWAKGAEVFLATRFGDLLHSTDTGRTFVVLGDRNWHNRGVAALWGNGAGEVIGVGSQETLIRSRDNGKHWTALHHVAFEVSTDRFSGVWGDGHSIVVVGDRIVRSTDGGETLREVGPRPPRRLEAVYGLGDGSVIAVGLHGLIVRVEDHGWRKVESGTSHDLHAVWGDGADVYAVGSHGTIATSRDAGRTFLAQSAAGTDDLLSVSGDSSGRVCAVGWATGRGDRQTMLCAGKARSGWQTMVDAPGGEPVAIMPGDNGLWYVLDATGLFLAGTIPE